MALSAPLFAAICRSSSDHAEYVMCSPGWTSHAALEPARVPASSPARSLQRRSSSAAPASCGTVHQKAQRFAFRNPHRPSTLCRGYLPRQGVGQLGTGADVSELEARAGHTYRLFAPLRPSSRPRPVALLQQDRANAQSDVRHSGVVERACPRRAQGWRSAARRAGRKTHIFAAADVLASKEA